MGFGFGFEPISRNDQTNPNVIATAESGHKCHENNHFTAFPKIKS